MPGILWIQEQPEAAANFNEYMLFHRKTQPICWDVYPVPKEAHGWDPDAVVLVDTGGGLGHQCTEFRKKFPGVPGRVVLQDLQGPVKSAVSAFGVESMVHDMFTPQPIKGTRKSHFIHLDTRLNNITGAKFYYLRNVLHDWPDHRCREILSNIVPAMGPDSTILLDEMVLPDRNVHWQAAQSDLATMAVLASIERTKGQWTALLDSVGLKIREVHEYNPSVHWSVLTAVPK